MSVHHSFDKNCLKNTRFLTNRLHLKDVDRHATRNSLRLKYNNRLPCAKNIKSKLKGTNRVSHIQCFLSFQKSWYFFSKF